MTRTLRLLTLLALSITFAFAAPAWKNQTVRVTWDDNTSNETGFLIERSTDGVRFYPLGAVAPDVTVFYDTGLSPRTYLYRVYALLGSDRTAASNVASVVVEK